jgi:POT family proton-dependent oligopeptide transporter
MVINHTRTNTTNNHPKGFWPLAFSLGLDRFAYFGIYGTVLSYLFQMTYLDVAAAYETEWWFLLFVGVLPVVGGFIGDFVSGAKRSIIAGLFLQAIGCFMLAIPAAAAALYVGLASIGIGLWI